MSMYQFAEIGLGQMGTIFEDTTGANISSKKIVAIQFVDDTAFTTLTPSDTAKYIGTGTGNGQAVDSSNVFPAGMTIYGRWTTITLASGAIIAYQGQY
jgi:hypothetical protein